MSSKTNDYLFDASNHALTKILEELDSIREKYSDPLVLTVVYVSNIHVIADSMGLEFLHTLKNLLTNEFGSALENVITVGPVSDQRYILVSSPSSRDKLKEEVSSVFMNLRKHEVIAVSQVTMSYKCGSIVMEKGVSTNACYAKACMAFYEAFSQDSYKHFFADEIPDKLLDSINRMKLASYFQDAIHDNRLRLAFQPVINAKSNEVHSYECLLRLLNCDGDIISAGPFITAAEKMGFMDEVDGIVLELVATELRQSPNICLGMNISNVSIDTKKWLNKAKNLLKDQDLASRLMIEITETSAQRDLDKLSYFVEFVRDLGCQIAIDDFGSGYTSFKQLQFLQADVIKIDGMFIRDIVTNYNNRFFVQMMLDCSKTFNMKTVAEFVENAEIARVLKELDIDYMQGNYLGPAVNYRSWIKADRHFK